MRAFKKIMTVFIVAIIVCSMFACSCKDDPMHGEPGYNENFVLELDKTSVTLMVNERTTVTANTNEATWDSSRNDIASVVGGVIIGVSAGNAIITAKYKDQQVTCSVTVVEKEDDYTSFPVLAFACKANTIVTGYSFQLDAFVMVDSQEVQLETAISFESSNSGVLSVTQDGVVTGVAKGVATIMASVNYNGELLREALEIKVENEIRFVKFKNVVDVLVLELGQSFMVETEFASFAQIYDSSEIEWESSKSAIATVANGTVTGMNYGTTTVFAKYNGTVLNSFQVEVRRTAFDFETPNDLIFVETYKSENWTLDADVSRVKYSEEQAAYANGTITTATPTNFAFSAPANGGSYALKVSNWSQYKNPCVKFTFGYEIPVGTQIKFNLALNLGDAQFSAANGWVPLFIGSEGNIVCYNYGMSPSYISWYQNYMSTGGFYWAEFTYTTTKASDHIIIGVNGANGNSKMSTATLNTLVMYFDNVVILSNN